MVHFKPKPGSQFRGNRPVLRKGPVEPPVEQAEGTRKWKREWREDDKFFGSELKDHFGFQFKWSSNGVQVELVEPQMPFSHVKMWPVRIYYARWQFVSFWMRFCDLGGPFLRVILMVLMVIFMVPDPRSISSRRARKGARSADNPPKGSNGYMGCLRYWMCLG